jgi:cardiolipin synthase
MQIQIQVDAGEFWPSLQQDIHGAKQYVFVQTLSFEGDRVGAGLANSLLSSGAPDRRIIADEFYTRHRINDKLLCNPRNWFNASLREERAKTFSIVDRLTSNGVGFKLTGPSGFLLSRFLHRNHKKIVVIDDRVAYIGGINFSEHNFDWHDMMLRIEDPAVARFLRDDFVKTWDGREKRTHGQHRGIDLYGFDGVTNERAFQPILDMIEEARESIYVTSPYVTYPFFGGFRRAVRNGARVSLVSPKKNNWRLLKEYGMWECARSGIEVYLYPGRMSHLKAMLIDDRHLVVGSSNFDFLSWHYMQEIVAVITDANTISQFKKKVLIPDLEQSVLFDGAVSDLTGRCHHMSLRGLNKLYASLTWLSAFGR